MGTRPRNFSFIDEFIAGSAFPYEKKNLDFYLDQGICNIVSITSDKLLALEYSDKSKFNHLQIPLSGPPQDKEAIHQFVKFLKNAQDNQEKVVVHCQFGQERTGILLAIYLVKFKGFKMNDAIEYIRNKRPHSLQTHSSLKFLLEKFSDD